MISRMLKKPLESSKSFFLFGPRGTGKTHWVRSCITDAIYIDLLKVETYTDLLSNPSRIEAMIPDDYAGWVIIDEVQKIPALLNEVHRLIEEKHYKFVLTGSSARKLRKKGVNLLAGRALVYRMYPLTIHELGEKFDIKFSLQYGMLPALLSEQDPKHYLKAYVDTYLQEEIMQEGLTQNLSAFIRFLEAASFSQGQTLNISAVARDCSVNRKVVESYFDILESLMISYRLPVFTKRAKRETIMHPKFYYFDAGVYASLKPVGILDNIAETEGAALETLFFQELYAINDYLSLEYNFSYWRTKSGIEVDFIAYGARGLVAFEIKRTDKVNPHDCKGLLAFADEYPEATLYLLYGGSQELYFKKVTVLPMVQALKKLSEIL